MDIKEDTVEKLFNKIEDLEKKINILTKKVNYIPNINKFSEALFSNFYGYSAAEFSKSQFSADLFVLKELKLKRDGFFVEFGASDGIAFSNTYLLETCFNWKGILAEPNLDFFSKLKRNRNSICTNELISGENNKVYSFIQDNYLGTIQDYSQNNKQAEHRNQFIKSNPEKVINIKSISLNEFLKKYKAPKRIDYISIDTEGSEYDIIKNFNFDLFEVSIFTIEHNFVKENRDNIFHLMSKKGYKRIPRNVDDWYINYEYISAQI